MQKNQISGFIAYCKVSGFKTKSIESLSLRLSQFNGFVNQSRIQSIRAIQYRHLRQFVADFGQPSIHVKKSRIWALRQFYHYLTLTGQVEKNVGIWGRAKLTCCIFRFSTLIIGVFRLYFALFTPKIIIIGNLSLTKLIGSPSFNALAPHGRCTHQVFNVSNKTFASNGDASGPLFITMIHTALQTTFNPFL